MKLRERFHLLLAELAHLQFALNGLPGVVQQHGQNSSHSENAANDGAAICGKVAKGAADREKFIK